MIQSELDIQSTSLEAFRSILINLGDRQRLVFNTIKNNSGVSNLDISRILGIPINCVTPRVKELRDLGLVELNGIKKDRVTDRNMMCWMVKE